VCGLKRSTDNGLRVYEGVGTIKAQVMLIDNYDSFTYNLVQAFCSLGAQVTVVLNNQADLETLLDPKYTHFVISPGPGHPNKREDFGICYDLLQSLPNHKPLLGVCLGCQGIAAHFGAEIKRAPKVMHGKVSFITHQQRGLFSNLLNPMPVMRYHSLCIDQETLSTQLIPTAYSEDGVLMGFEHRERPIYGVQFHPESVGTPQGDVLLDQFLDGL
jgi:anthranilate synthase component II